MVLNGDGKARCAFPCATGVDLFVATNADQTPPDLRGALVERGSKQEEGEFAGHNAEIRRRRHDLRLTLQSSDRGLHKVARGEHAHRVAFLGVARSRSTSWSTTGTPPTRRKSATGCATAAAGTRRSRASPSEARARRKHRATRRRAGRAARSSAILLWTRAGLRRPAGCAAAPPLKLVARDGGREFTRSRTATSYASPVRGHDFHLTSTRQGWLAWRESKSQEPRKEEFFVLKTDGALTLHAPFSLVSLVRPESSVALATGAPSSRYGGGSCGCGRSVRPRTSSACAPWTSSKIARTSRSTTTWKRIRDGASPR